MVEAEKDMNLYNFLTNERKLSYKWRPKKTSNKHVHKMLSDASKNFTNLRKGD